MIKRPRVRVSHGASFGSPPQVHVHVPTRTCYVSRNGMQHTGRHMYAKQDATCIAIVAIIIAR